MHLQYMCPNIMVINFLQGCDMEDVLLKHIGPIPAVIVSKDLIQGQQGSPTFIHAEEAPVFCAFR